MNSPEIPEGNRAKRFSSISSSYLASLIVLSAGTFVLRSSTNMFNTNLPLVAREIFDFDNTSVGALSGLVALAGFTSITFVNAKLESTWRRRLFIVSAFSYCTTFSFVPLVGLWGLWVLAASSGFFIQLIMINQANASGIIGKAISERERGIALYTIALSASLVVGPLVNSAILTRVSLAYSFAAFSVFPISAAILALFFPFPKEEHSKSQNDLQTPILKNADPPTPPEARSFRATLKNPGFQTALFINAMYSIPFAAIVSFGGLFSHDYYHASNISVQFYFAIFYSVSFCLQVTPPSVTES